MAGTQFPPFPIGKLYNASPSAQPTDGPDNVALLAHIEADEPSQADLDAAGQFLSRFTYAATALAALAAAMRELEADLGDDNTDASALLLRAAGEMAPIDAACA